MALPPGDWPNRLPSLPSDTSKCGLCHDFAFKPGSTSAGDGMVGSELKAYYWSWELYGPRCQFCNVIRETFWHIAGTLGYTRYELLEDFRYLLVSVFFEKGTVILNVQPPVEPHTLARNWANQQWYLALAQKVDTIPWCSIPEIQYNPGSIRKAAATIKPWLQQCAYEHSSRRCQSRFGEFVPTRLIRIDPLSRRLKLVESKGISVPYTALSYCWGEQPQEETMKQNLHQRLRGHELDHIAKLLRDATLLTAACDIEYIWIDAICIVQDDDSDRLHELSKMADIYSHAIFTISAAHAHNVHQGLIAPERDWIPIPNRLATGSSPSSILVRSIAQHDPIGLPLPGDTTWPAFERCWTFQERLISSRVVHFAPEELIWECASGVTCQCSLSLKVRERDSIKWGFDCVQGKQLDEHVFHTLWHMLVTASTQRRLSRDSDRLVALGGLAERLDQYAGRRLGKYLAGMWEKDVEKLYGISWQAVAASSRQRPEVWVAPSWSWASLKGEINFPQPNPKLCRSHARVDRVRCNPQSPQNPYGQFESESGEMKLTGAYLDVMFDHDNVAGMLMASVDGEGGMADVDYEWNWDMPITNSAGSEVVNGDSLTLVLLWSSWPEQPQCPYLTLLVLRPHPTYSKTWMRMGVVCPELGRADREERAKLNRWIASLDTGTFRIL